MSGGLVTFSWGNEPPGGVQTWPSGLYRCHQGRELHDIKNPPQIIGESSQAELATNLFYAAHQECALVHPLFERAMGTQSTIPYAGVAAAALVGSLSPWEFQLCDVIG
jgi:hypothetical protein